jgi:3-hydroxyisobutyrate dehydrogenase
MTARAREPNGVVGFVGLGTMGGPMCRRLADTGIEVVAYDVDGDAAAAAARGAGVRIAASPAAVGEAARVVVLMLPDGAAVREAVLGDDALLVGMRDGSLLVDMSSSDPLGTLELASTVGDHGVAFVDAPVSGSPAAAGEGRLTVMAGGDDEPVGRCRPVLDALGTVVRTGPLGSAHAVKALNNTLAAVALAASGEALLVARRFGLDPGVVLEVLNRSTGRNDATENKLAQFVLSRAFASGFKLELMAKDLRTAVRLADATRTPAPFGRACLDLWTSARHRLGPGVDNTAVVLAMEQDAGVTLGDSERPINEQETKP